MEIKRHLSAMAIAATAICCISCGGNKTNDNAEVAPADSDTTATVQVEQQPKELLQTPDLKVFDLRGNVKKTVVKGASHNANWETQALEYDEQGRLTKFDDITISYAKNENGQVKNPKGQTVKRDKQGRPLHIYMNDGCSGKQGRHFEYTKTGYSCEYDYGECSGITTLTVTLDGEGRETDMKSEWYDESGEDKLTYHYTYTKFDECRNWTERKVDWKDEYTEYTECDESGEEQNKVTKEKGSFVQKRTITYYDK